MMFDLLPPPEPKVLRPHQAKAIEMLRHSLAKGNKRIVIQGPTGFGKTLVAAKIAQGALAKGNDVIFTAPFISLIDQTMLAFEQEGIRDIGVIQSSHPLTNPLARVQVGSVQTLARRTVPHAAVVIVDECHIRSRVIEELMDERADAYFIGLSATPWAKGMGERWQTLVVPCSVGDLISNGYLSQFTAYAPAVPDLTGVRVRDGDFLERDLEAVMSGQALMASVVETWLEKGENRPTLLFGVNRAHARALVEEFTLAGVPAGYVDAFTDVYERKLIERQFREGYIKIVASVRTLTTGVDWPVSCLIDAAPTKSEMLHVQKIGRGLRIKIGTEDLIILDHAGNSLRLGLVTDIHRSGLDNTAVKARQNRTVRAKSKPQPCCHCEALYSGLACPYCGAKKKISSGVCTVAGELEVLGATDSVSPPTRTQKQQFWSMALCLDDQRGKGGKLAKSLFKAKFGAWPRGLHPVRMAPDQAFLNYEKSRRVAYAKRRKVGGQG